MDSSRARTVSDASNSLSRSPSPSHYSTLLLRHDTVPSLPHHALGRPSPPLWDVASPTLLWHAPSYAPSLWDTPPCFFLFRSPLTLTVHRGPPLAHRREGAGFFHDAAPFRSRTRGTTLHLVRFLSFSFSFADCSPFPHNVSHLLVRPFAPHCVAPRRCCCIAPVCLSLSLPL
jgi:hypothetical protein